MYDIKISKRLYHYDKYQGYIGGEEFKDIPENDLRSKFDSVVNNIISDAKECTITKISDKFTIVFVHDGLNSVKHTISATIKGDD